MCKSNLFLEEAYGITSSNNGPAQVALSPFFVLGLGPSVCRSGNAILPSSTELSWKDWRSHGMVWFAASVLSIGGQRLLFEPNWLSLCNRKVVFKHADADSVTL